MSGLALLGLGSGGVLVVTGFAAAGLFAPLALRRGLWVALPHKLRAGTCFAALGLGFMYSRSR